jgi:hypothetical protein
MSVAHFFVDNDLCTGFERPPRWCSNSCHTVASTGVFMHARLNQTFHPLVRCAVMCVLRKRLQFFPHT